MLNKLKKRKRAKKIIITILLTMVLGLITVWVIMQLNTNSVIDEVESALYHNNDNTDYSFDKIYNKTLYGYLNLRGGYNESDLKQYDISVDVNRIYMVNNFKSGYIWIKYKIYFSAKDKASIESYSEEYFLKLKIKKDKKWIVEDMWLPDHWCDENMEHGFWFTSKME